MGGDGSADAFTRPDDSVATLPIDIAFLRHHGIAPATLREIADRAHRLGVEASREAITSGAIDEEGYYRAFAGEMGLRFEEGPVPLMPGGRYGDILRGGVAPLRDGEGDGARFALAPEGPALRQMLAAGPRHRGDIVVTTPRRFAAGLRAANAASLARHAAGMDAAGLTRASARTGSARGQLVAAGGGVGTVGFYGTWAPLETFFALALLAGPLFLGLIVLRLASVFERPPVDLWRSHRWRIDAARLPVYTVAVPLRREEKVLPQLLGALAALDYPAAKLDILLLIEADDPVMQAALGATTLPAHMRVLIVPHGLPHTKPRALNLGLLEARGSLFTIFDAEDIPDPQQLRLAAARFLRTPPDLACLQARLVIDHAGEGVLPALFALEYAGLFEVLNPGLLKCGLPILLGGTSNHFRTQALRSIGGWDAWNVTEDADLGVRLVRAGYRMGDLPSSTREEAPLTVRAWLKQRARWIKGYMQTLVTHLAAPLALVREAGLAATLTFLSLALGTVVTALGYPVFALVMVLVWHDGSLLMPGTAFGDATAMLALTIWVTGLVAMLAPAALGALRRGSPQLLMLLPLLPLYYALVSVAAWIALYDYVARRFTWNKTMHGLARQRRPGS